LKISPVLFRQPAARLSAIRSAAGQREQNDYPGRQKDMSTANFVASLE